MASDIRPFGTGEGVGFYWVKVGEQFGPGYCELIAIDEIGNVTTASARLDYEEVALTRGEAVIQHLAPAIREANKDLEKRRANAPEPEEKPERLDPATAAFLADESY
ncbi:MAG: hypothetical protein KDB58_07270 [Solirubrobacterales bacterium]|nr:hypothetical protein [Solirubrobacterales bacterium]MCB8970279.1 hypothetical protein [Thermoleophilales bacterium]MCB9617791.1 hypothetical protein [Sandaracinus sp.]